MTQKQGIISTAHLAAARAVDHLRRQLGFVIQDDSGAALAACPVEGLSEPLLAALAPHHLLLTAARAKSLGLDVPPGSKNVCIEARGLSLAGLQALADPLLPAPALRAVAQPATPTHDMLLALAKHAGLLPAMVVAENKTPDDWVTVGLGDIRAYWQEPVLDLVPLAEAALPVAGLEQARMLCFRERFGTSVHLALVAGDMTKHDAPLVRVHSSCVTGDILGSLRCDCGDQLRLAIDAIGAEGAGVLLYLHQEGRGIGIANKLRAYALQERGCDTYDANLMLGFDEDERNFALAAALLRALGVARVRLLTNNPKKIDDLRAHGIAVAERRPLVAPPGAHNRAYIDAKGKKAGHLF